jgi:hypothetical protein
MAAADTLYEVMTLMVKKGPLSKTVGSDSDGEGAEGSLNVGAAGELKK